MPSTKTHCAQRCLSIFCLVILTLAALDSDAQHSVPGSISGLVVDSSGKGLGNVSITLLRVKDSTLVKGTISSADGKYMFQHPAYGTYLVNTSVIAYRNAWSASFTLDSLHQKIVVPNLVLLNAAASLQEVTIVAKKPLFEQKIDRMVVNVANSITSAGGTALEVLERSPGVLVDQQNYSISMNGKDGVVVMINGKINRMPMNAVVQMLAGMSADNIEKIELITTPPANFDAEGNAGYINIVLKANNQFGTNGSYTVTGGYGKKEIGEASLNFNHRNSKLNYYGDFSFSRLHSKMIFDFYHKISNNGDTTETNSDANRDFVRLFYTGKLGLDYELSKKTIIGVFVSGYDNRFTDHSINTTTVVRSHSLDSSLLIKNDEVNDWYNMSGNFNLAHSFSADEKLSLNVNYDHYRDNNPNDYLDQFFNNKGIFMYDQRLRSSKITPINVWVGALDYTKKISPKVNLEAGLKTTASAFRNNVEIDTLVNGITRVDDSLSVKYNLQENIQAAYTAFTIAFSNKTSIKAGLRYEYTVSNLGSEKQSNIVDRHYGNLFPSFFFSHTVNDKNSFNLAYSRRITRPTFNDMAPFLIFMDPYTFFSGNPALQPSITDAVSGAYTLRGKILSVSYSYEANPITNFSPTIDSATNIQTLAADNQKDQKTVAVSLSLPFTITKWWSMQNNVTAIWQQLDALINKSQVRIKQANFSISSTQTFTLPKNFSLELSGNYFSKSLFGIYKLDPWGVLNLGIQKKLPNHRSTIRFNISNLLNSSVFKPYVNLPDQNLVASGKLVFEYPSFRLTFTHNFGNDKVKQSRDRSTGAEEEKQRVHQ